MRKYIPDIITLTRIPASAALLLLENNAAAFWIVYLWCGLSDMLDGFLARRLRTESRTGAMLDSLADLAFAASCCWVFIHDIALPRWVWICIAVIAGVKVINVISSLAVYRKVIFPHTVANKVTGLLLFILLPVVLYSGLMIPAAITIAVAVFAAVQEGHLIRTRKISR